MEKLPSVIDALEDISFELLLCNELDVCKDFK